MFQYQTETENKTKTDYKVYITGSVAGKNKKQLQQMVEDNGLNWSKSISKNLDLLVYGYKAGSVKMKKADNLNIKTIPFTTFEGAINDNNVESLFVENDSKSSKPKKNDLTRFF